MRRRCRCLCAMQQQEQQQEQQQQDRCLYRRPSCSHLLHVFLKCHSQLGFLPAAFFNTLDLFQHFQHLVQRPAVKFLSIIVLFHHAASMHLDYSSLFSSYERLVCLLWRKLTTGKWQNRFSELERGFRLLRSYFWFLLLVLAFGSYYGGGCDFSSGGFLYFAGVAATQTNRHGHWQQQVCDLC